ncbi:MAG: lipoprotein insertase outer membrane protein LolB [Cocleimonas sp.]|nr:lipoprotein insertase outer membrane protein LolB [Cocleimonas sp.]
MISRIFLGLAVGVSLMTLNGCSTIGVNQTGKTKPSVSVPKNTKEGYWKQRQQLLGRDSTWNLNSKVALRYRAEHFTFGLNWAQKNAQQYVMLINNPVTGGVVAKLSRDKAGVSLLSDDGKTYRDTDEERLLKRQSGIELPLKGMQYWARGLTSPLYKTDKVVLDASGRPQSIYQAGWKIDYSRYASNKFNAMPGKVIITRSKDSVYLKMIAKRWQGI